MLNVCRLFKDGNLVEDTATRLNHWTEPWG